MAEIAAIAGLVLLSIIIGMASAAGMLYLVFKKRFIQPVEVFEKESKKTFWAPDSGVFVLKDKRKVKVASDERAWLQEMDERHGQS